MMNRMGTAARGTFSLLVLVASVVCATLVLPALPFAGAAMSSSESQLIGSLPPRLQVLYQSTTDPVLPSAYNDFRPPQGPWKICFADSYEGNAWRLDVRKGLEWLTDQFKSAGKTSGIDVAVSNNDVALQNSQVRSFIDHGCSVILSIPVSTTGLDAAIKAAYDHGIPFISLAGAVTSPYAINVDSNYFLWGKDMAGDIASALHGKGTVVMVKGIEGQPVAVAENQGAETVWRANSGLRVAARVNGNWTPSVTRSVILQVLTTHPESIDAVWTTGSEMRFVALSFEQAHRPVPLITGSPTGDTIAYAKAHPSVKMVGGAVLPSWTAETVFRVAIRILSGQRPRLNTLMVPIPRFSTDELGGWYAPCMTEKSVTPFPVAPESPLPESVMNGYFANGAPTPPYNYAQFPKACQ